MTTDEFILWCVRAVLMVILPVAVVTFSVWRELRITQRLRREQEDALYQLRQDGRQAVENTREQ